jgi:hypothetical protein
MYIFVFQCKEMKTQGLNNNLIYRPYCKKTETNQEGYQEENTNPNMQGQPMKYDEKEKPPNVLSLCRHLTVMTETQEDSTTIKTYPENTKINN